MEERGKKKTPTETKQNRNKTIEREGVKKIKINKNNHKRWFLTVLDVVPLSSMPGNICNVVIGMTV